MVSSLLGWDVAWDFCEVYDLEGVRVVEGDVKKVGWCMNDGNDSMR